MSRYDWTTPPDYYVGPGAPPHRRSRVVDASLWRFGHNLAIAGALEMAWRDGYSAWRDGDKGPPLYWGG